MIQVTKLNNAPMIVNIDAIKYVEATPDTVIYFVNGDSLIVRESLEELKNRAYEFKATILKKAWEISADEPTRHPI